MLRSLPRIKICGITRHTDAQMAARLGADAVGFVLADSPRRMEPHRVRQIRLSLPPVVRAVGVFVDEEPEFVAQMATFCGFDWVQLHGHETPDYCNAVGFKPLKAIRVKDKHSIKTMAAYQDCVAGFVLDTYVEGQQGGTGKTFDWTLAKRAKQYGPILLSGGLTPDDVRQAIKQVGPHGVDVSSGVESAPGIKDHQKLRRFVAEARAEMGDVG